MTDIKQKFYDITSLIQVEFDRNLEIYGDKIQCRKGCSKCCSQIFKITLIDAYIIQDHIRALPRERREELQQKARDYISHLPQEEKHSDHPGSSSHPSLEKEGSSLYCPALGTEGECTIYEARPVICRRFGMPIYDYKNPQNVHACELNFADGDEITDELLVPNQTTIGMKWDELKEEFVASGHRTDKSIGTTIAEAIAEA
ncbi:MAG: YkgJ family cysteine cluster protein [Ignavibacteria bacterium]|nr:YkgJ family cysteine cluster protein [Ignavibacteria bacterium]